MAARWCGRQGAAAVVKGRSADIGDARGWRPLPADLTPGQVLTAARVLTVAAHGRVSMTHR